VELKYQFSFKNASAPPVTKIIKVVTPAPTTRTGMKAARPNPSFKMISTPYEERVENAF
jgi:hypothetical protein